MTPLQLRRALTALGWSFGELERRIGASHVQVWRWLRGHYPVPDEIAAWLAECVRIGNSMPPAPKDWRR